MNDWPVNRSAPSEVGAPALAHLDDPRAFRSWFALADVRNRTPEELACMGWVACLDWLRLVHPEAAVVLAGSISDAKGDATRALPSISMPTTPDHAVGLLRFATDWLKGNAPDRLAQERAVTAGAGVGSTLAGPIIITAGIEAAYRAYLDQTVDTFAGGEPISRRQTHPYAGSEFSGMVPFAAGFQAASGSSVAAGVKGLRP